MARRLICTQTPLFLLRKKAPPAPSSMVAPGLAGSAASLISRARAAAANGDAAQCLALIWDVRDLPRGSAVRRELDTPKAAMGADPTGLESGDGGAEAPARTLLQEAAFAGLHEPVRILLEELQASVQPKDADGRTALHFASEGGHADVAQLLLARGRAHVDARDAHGQTSLLLAAGKGHIRAAKALVRFSADITAADKAGRTPLMAAKALADGELAEWLEKYTAKRRLVSDGSGKISYVKSLGAQLPSHVVAPKLVLTPIGFCPVDDDGNVVQLKRGIRVRRGRPAPSTPSGIVNWYAPRG